MRREVTRVSLLTGKTSDFLKIGVAAAGRGDLDVLRGVLREKPEWVRRVGSHGRTMLWEAAWRGQLEAAELLLDEGADIDACGCHFTPLLVEVSPYCAALFKKRDALAALLLERGATKDFFSRVFLGETDAVRLSLRDDPLLATQQKPQHDPNVCATALHYAVSPGHGALVEMLLEHGADPRPYGEWLIRFCIWRNRPDILETLLDAGVDAASAEPPRAGVADPRIVEVLERHGMAVDPDRAEGGWPPLVFHCRGDRGGDVQGVRRLLDAGADVNVRNHKAQTALHCAAKAGFVAIAALLVERGADVDAEDGDGATPLAAALRSTIKDERKLLDVAALLLRCGADPLRRDRKGRSPRDIAARKRNTRAWLACLDAG